MRKLNIIIAFLFVASLAFVACEKTPDEGGEDISKITYFPSFKMEGSNLIFVKKGDGFTEPGVTAEEAGKALEVGVSVTGAYSGYSGTEVNLNVPDKYTIVYSAVNGDGYAGKTERVVWVYEDEDLTSGLAGIYTSTVYRGGELAFEDLEYFLISSLDGGGYSLQCGVGGYYDLGRAYGSDYSAQGAVVTVNDLSANDFSITDSQFPLWGNVVSIGSMSVDASNKTVSFSGTADFGAVFDVILTKVEF